MIKNTKKPRQFKTIILEDLNKRKMSSIASKITSITYETYSMGNSLNVRTKDLFKSERGALKMVLNEYAYGRFDAMTDYAYSERDASKERQAKYVSINNDFSEVIKNAVKEYYHRLGIIDDVTAMKEHNTYYYQLLYQKTNSLESYDDAIKLLD